MRLRGEVSDGRAVLQPGYVCRGKGQHGRVRPDLILEPWGRAERWDFSVPPSGLPQVRFLCGVTEVIRADRWTVQASGGQLLSRQQLPLQLAWAISIHKSQVSRVGVDVWGRGQGRAEVDKMRLGNGGGADLKGFVGVELALDG